jgi:hypothetical protein
LTIAAGAPGFKEEAQAVLTDAIVPRVNAVRETVSRSTALQHALKEQPIRVTFGAIAAGRRRPEKKKRTTPRTALLRGQSRA